MVTTTQPPRNLRGRQPDAAGSTPFRSRRLIPSTAMFSDAQTASRKRELTQISESSGALPLRIMNIKGIIASDRLR